MNLTDFQSAVAAAVSAAAWVSGVSVVTDDGLQDAVIEAALADTGTCIVVGMPSEGEISGPVGKSASSSNRLRVSLRMNAQRNSEQTTPRVAVVGLAALIVAINSYTDLPRVRSLSATAYALSQLDVGLLVYDIIVTAAAEHFAT